MTEPRFAIEPLPVHVPEPLGPWLRAVLFILLGVVFALGFLISA